MNIKLVIEYDGTDFFGFEKQPGCRTVRGELEKAVNSLTNKRPQIYCAGRTDRGVHATGQVISFKLKNPFSISNLRNGLNGLLPRDIYVKSAQKVPQDFNARYAQSRIYLYKILIGRSPVRRRWVWEYYKFTLNLNSIRELLPYFEGMHNFEKFSFKDSGICNIKRFELRKIDDEIHFEIEGDRFLHKMVRMIIGTIELFSRNKVSRSEIMQMLESHGRKGFTAPSQGLYLKEVRY